MSDIEGLETLIRILDKKVRGGERFTLYTTKAENVSKFRREHPRIYKAIMSEYPENVVEDVENIIDLFSNVENLKNELEKEYGFGTAPWLNEISTKDDKAVITMYVRKFVRRVCEKEIPFEIRYKGGKEYYDKVMECIDRHITPKVRRFLGENAKISCDFTKYEGPECIITVELD